ncbi:MAG: response regulator transcription factor [Chloroflexi bacterium]|nr:response regulator transcription factor [Chloroflexota bacterium]
MPDTLIVAAYPAMRAGLQVMVEANPEARVLRQVANPHEMVLAARDLHPDVILLDPASYEAAALEALWELRKVAPESGVIVFTPDDTDALTLNALQAGARGYLLRQATSQEIGQAIRTVAQGGLVMHPMAAATLLRKLNAATSTAAKTERDQLSARPSLTQRELEVLQLLAEGLSNKILAARLNISEHTVKFHVSSIMQELGASSRTEAVALAARQGLILL